MVWAGALIVLLTFAAIIKKFETRLCLLLGGVALAILSGKPWPVMESFVATMTHRTIVPTICSVMGFAYVLKYTECDKNLVHALSEPIKKLKLFIIPASMIATFAINTSLTSAAGCGAAVGAILIPAMIAAGISPAMAASAILAGTWGSMFSPGSAQLPVIAKVANTDIISIMAGHLTASLAAFGISVVALTVTAIVLKEHVVLENNAAQAVTGSEPKFKVNYIKAIIPIIPLAILVSASKQVGFLPEAFYNVPLAMIIGSVCCYLATLKSPAAISKEFFSGMGHAYGHIIGLIVAATVLTKGMEVAGLTGALIDAMKSTKSLAGFIAAFGPFAVAVISGSGDAATMTFNTAITPHAADFGMEAGKMGSLAFLTGQVGRSMSPVAGVTLVCAGIAAVNPMELAKRNAIPMLLAAIVAMLLLT